MSRRRLVGLLIAIVGIVLLGSAEEPPNTQAGECRRHAVTRSDDVTWWTRIALWPAT